MQLQLDYKAACEARDAGLKVAEDHANAVEPGWSDKAYEFLKDYLARNPNPFMVEELRAHAVVEDFPLPAHARAWGGIIRRAAFAGLVQKLDTKPTSNPKSHCANANLWQKV